MANTLSKTGIVDNSTIRVWHVTQSIDAFTGVSAYNITLSGSLNIEGPLNLDSPVTGNLITSASYVATSSYALTSISASNTSYASASYDVLTIQLHHQQFDPTQASDYYFSINPFEPSLNDNQSGTYPRFPSPSYIISASISTTINRTTGTSETSTYALHIGDNIKTFTNTLSHNIRFSSFVEEVDLPVLPIDKIYMKWRTPPTWVTAPTQVSHNVVLYCTRRSQPIQ
jgi:hypothetical protein